MDVKGTRAEAERPMWRLLHSSTPTMVRPQQKCEYGAAPSPEGRTFPDCLWDVDRRQGGTQALQIQPGGSVVGCVGEHERLDRAARAEMNLILSLEFE